MENNGSGGSGLGGDLVGNDPRGEEMMGVQTGSQSTGGGSTGTGDASVMVGNPLTGDSDENQTTGGGGEQRAAEGKGGAPVVLVVVGSPAAATGGGLTVSGLNSALKDLEREGSRIGTHEPISTRMTGSSTTEAVGEGLVIEDIMEDDGGVEEAPRDQSKGKPPERQIADELLRVGRVAFIPPQGSSATRPTYYYDFAEMMGEERLAELYRMDPGLVSVIMRMREEHVAEQERRNEEVRLAMEREAALREDETDEVLEEEERGPSISAVEEAKKAGRPGFDEDGVPHLPEPHLIVIRGFEPYKPKRETYGAGVVRRDPEGHRAEN